MFYIQTTVYVHIVYKSIFIKNISLNTNLLYPVLYSLCARCPFLQFLYTTHFDKYNVPLFTSCHIYYAERI